MAKEPNIDAHWHHHFDALQISTEAFYRLVAELIKAKNLPKVKVYTYSCTEGTLFSPNRLYLRVERSGFAFDVCAAPFGKEYFVSWWLIRVRSLLWLLINIIPIVNWILLGPRNQRTYYQMDTEIMFKESIHSIILEAIDIISKEKGFRTLSESERQIHNDVKII